MSQDEQEEDLVECADCGATIAAGADASYAFGNQGVLCFECAIRRGGEYDGPKERWTVMPDVAGLAEDAAADV